MPIGLSLYKAHRFVWDHIEMTTAWIRYSDLIRARSTVVSRYL